MEGARVRGAGFACTRASSIMLTTFRCWKAGAIVVDQSTGCGSSRGMP